MALVIINTPRSGTDGARTALGLASPVHGLALLFPAPFFFLTGPPLQFAFIPTEGVAADALAGLALCVCSICFRSATSHVRVPHHINAYTYMVHQCMYLHCIPKHSSLRTRWSATLCDADACMCSVDGGTVGVR